MDCPICKISMEEYEIETAKIKYRDNGEDTEIRMGGEIYICPNCKAVVGKALQYLRCKEVLSA